MRFEHKRIVVNHEVQYSTSNLTVEPDRLTPGSEVTIEFNLEQPGLLRAHLSDDRPTMITFDHEGEEARFQCAVMTADGRANDRFTFTGTYEPT